MSRNRDILIVIDRAYMHNLVALVTEFPGKELAMVAIKELEERSKSEKILEWLGE